MSVATIYPLSFLGSLLREDGAVTMNLQRHDELSGSGDGRYWAAELARPIWTAQMNLMAMGRGCVGRAREIDAKIRALGVNRTFLWADPTYGGPSGGTISGGIYIASISADRTAIAFSGLPAGFVLAPGDRFSVECGTGRYYLGELTEAKTANGSGVTEQVGIYPYPPLALTAGAAVEMMAPIMKAIVPPNGYAPYGYQRKFVAQGATLTILQKP